jgi:hypothetical protein
MADNEEKTVLSPEETAQLVNDLNAANQQLSAENNTIRKMLTDLGNKIAKIEIQNSELKVANTALNEVLASVSGTTTPAPVVEEE